MTTAAHRANTVYCNGYFFYTESMSRTFYDAVDFSEILVSHAILLSYVKDFLDLIHSLDALVKFYM